MLHNEGMNEGDELWDSEEDWSAPCDSSERTVYDGATTLSEIVGNRTELESTNKSDIIGRMRLDDTKAGMQGLDKDRINQIIIEASKGSKFYENEQRKEEQLQQRLLQQRDALQKLTLAKQQEAEKDAEQSLEDLEARRDLSRTIVHIDMDAFYAAIEMRNNPTLRDKPMAVGSTYMLSTSNYLARRYGVRAAMPGFIGKKLCPDLVIVSQNMEKYRKIAIQVREVFKKYDPGFASMGLDEAYLDITEYLKRRPQFTEEERTFSHSVCSCTDKQWISSATCMQNVLGLPKKIETGILKCKNCLKYEQEAPVTFGNSAEDVVKEIRFQIEQRTQLTASAGILFHGYFL